MQSILSTAVLPKGAGGVAPASGAMAEDASAEGVDFSALLVAQIKSGKGTQAKLGVLPDEKLLGFSARGAEQDDKALAGNEFDNLIVSSLNAAEIMQTGQEGVAVIEGGAIDQPKGDARSASQEALLGGALNPLGVVAMPVPLAIAQQSASIGLPASSAGFASNPEKILASISGDGADPAQFGHESWNARNDLKNPAGVAEFAASGQMLPQDGLGNAKDSRGALLAMAEPLRAPEMPGNAAPLMMAASQSAVIDAKVSSVSFPAIQAPVGHSSWGDALGQRVVWMAGQQTQVAELHLNPPNLGPMEVRLSISHDQISALFVSHQPAVREALEAAMPRLRELFAESGMSLGNAMVSSDSLPQQQSSGDQGRPGASRQADFSALNDLHASQIQGGVIPLGRDAKGMVDLFA